MTADYNGWADRPEEEREAEEAAEVQPVDRDLAAAAGERYSPGQ
jgi:hypothetical protein